MNGFPGVILKPLEGKDVVEPGTYLCHPVVAFEAQPLWVVSVYPVVINEEKTVLCYRLPPELAGEAMGEERVVESCAHVFFGPVEIKTP